MEQHNHARFDKYKGCLFGLACGDALGTTLEFKNPGTFTPIDDIVGGGPFSLLPGQWTDDTSMALCLAESLIHCQGFDARDQCERYVDWMYHGHLSSNGYCFDVGNTVSNALSAFLKSKNPFSGPSEEYYAGNGSIMRLAPIALYYAHNPDEAIHLAGESSRTTHQTPACIDACKYLAGILVGLLNGVDKSEVLSPLYHPSKHVWSDSELCPVIQQVAAGSFREKNPPAICGSGYVVQSLEAALWAFAHSQDFESGALKAVNLGDDADSTGAVYGQMAGAYYGYENIPEKWRNLIVKQDLIIEYARHLYQKTTFT